MFDLLLKRRRTRACIGLWIDMLEECEQRATLGGLADDDGAIMAGDDFDHAIIAGELTAELCAVVKWLDTCMVNYVIGDEEETEDAREWLEDVSEKVSLASVRWKNIPRAPKFAGQCAELLRKVFGDRVDWLDEAEARIEEGDKAEGLI